MPPLSPPVYASPNPTAIPSCSKFCAIRDGIAVAITDAEILASLQDWAKNEGLFLSPEGAAATAAYDRLLASGFLTPDERVVLFNTGSGLKYTDVIAEAMHLQRPTVGT